MARRDEARKGARSPLACVQIGARRFEIAPSPRFAELWDVGVECAELGRPLVKKARRLVRLARGLARR